MPISTTLPIAMSSMYRVYRDVQYNLDYYHVKYRQRLYNNDRNPRLIQSRLQNRTLLSLRTCPHDKYVIPPGQFLSLGLNESDTDLFEDFDEVLVMKDEPTEASSVVDLVRLESDPEPSPNLLESGCSCSCHSSATSKIRQKVRQKLNRLLPERKEEETELVEMVKEPEISNFPQEIPYLLPSPPRITTSTTIQPAISRFNECLNSSKCQCTKCCKNQENVWKKVLNDVSLSAARLSTGSLPASRDEFDNLTSDFVDTKSKDVFAECLDQAKHNYADIILLYE